MRLFQNKQNQRKLRLNTSVVASCPACRAQLKDHPDWCPQCKFTGSDSMEVFAGTPPPLPPILDVASVWSPAELRSIASAQRKIAKRFPQFIWKICTVELDPTQSLDIFSFWMFNAAPLTGDETAEQRAWTVLLIIDAANHKATVTPGYSAEPWLSEQEWRQGLLQMREQWERGKTAGAVAKYLSTTQQLLEKSWQRLPPV
ncbi:hypothetical protein JIN85_18010 [Luteolibacter pohnpeiensis]|uniref:TPM domain-containing protein n=1 Tax=Luteolibacter pohnpeiensis TaxID=454153 RepID=A0A934SEB7_9BACT|nr:hypothetical protein [Luteolibacter pohnpeiensis]MBK1884319.1 hypothetical protein [Luteolibacter pohnpeiensis]